MIIAVQGTRKKSNNSIGATALLSSMTSILYNSKTLVLQIQNKKDFHVEDVLDKDHSRYRVSDGAYEFNTQGLDSLLMECNDKKELRKGLIAEKSDVFIKANGEPLLVVTPASENREFEEVAVEDIASLNTLLDSANSEYDYVFVLMPRNKTLATHLLAKASFNLIMLPQSEKAEILTFNDEAVKSCIPEGDNLKREDVYIIADYEEGSKFTQKKIRNDYNIKKTFVVYHNVDYRDAYNSHSILEFVKKNIDIDNEYDSNFMFIVEIKRLIAEYALDEIEENYDDLTFVADALETYEPAKREFNEMTSLDGYDVEFKTEKKGLFGKKTTEAYFVKKSDEEKEPVTTE